MSEEFLLDLPEKPRSPELAVLEHRSYSFRWSAHSSYTDSNKKVMKEVDRLIVMKMLFKENSHHDWESLRRCTKEEQSYETWDYPLVKDLLEIGRRAENIKEISRIFARKRHMWPKRIEEYQRRVDHEQARIDLLEEGIPELVSNHMWDL